MHENDEMMSSIVLLLRSKCICNISYRRSRGDMTETYKLLTGKYDQQVALALPKNVTGEYFTRGNSNKLLVKRMYCTALYCIALSICLSILHSIYLTFFNLPRPATAATATTTATA